MGAAITKTEGHHREKAQEASKEAIKRTLSARIVILRMRETHHQSIRRSNIGVPTIINLRVLGKVHLKSLCTKVSL
jgi:hypothetical protein